MKVHVLVSQKAANSSHRSLQQDVDVDVNDKIEDVKVKISMVYPDLDPANFYIQCNGARLFDQQIVLNILKRTNSQKLYLYIKPINGCCQII